MPKLVNIKGMRFGKLVVLERVGADKFGQALWKCICDCGTIKAISSNNLRWGFVTSCSCNMVKVKHGMAYRGKHSPTYRSWTHMVSRCCSKSANDYFKYGAKGITVTSEWLGEHGFENFLAYIGPRPDGTSIDRYPNQKGNYEPGNVRWATPTQQARNSSTAKINEEIASKIRNVYAEGKITLKELGRQYNLSDRSVCAIVRFETWK